MFYHILTFWYIQVSETDQTGYFVLKQFCILKNLKLPQYLNQSKTFLDIKTLIGFIPFICLSFPFAGHRF